MHFVNKFKVPIHTKITTTNGRHVTILVLDKLPFTFSGSFAEISLLRRLLPSNFQKAFIAMLSLPLEAKY